MTSTDLRDQIQSIQILNMDIEESTITSQQLVSKERAATASFIISDVDEELIVLIGFKQNVDLHSIKLFSLSHPDANDTSQPKRIHIYNIDNLNKNFDDLKATKPDKTVKCFPKKLEKGQFINLKKNSKNSIKFKKTRNLAIYITSNQNETEKTHINSIKINGKPNSHEQHKILIEQKEIIANIDLSMVHKNKYTKITDNFLFDQTDKQNKAKLDDLLKEFKETEEKTETFKQSDHLLIPSECYNNQSTDTSCNLSQCESFKRVSNLMEKYGNCIAQKMEIAQVFDEKQTIVSTLNDFHHLLNIHESVQEFEYIYKNMKGDSCQLSDCLMMRRTHRDRCNSKELSELYFQHDSKDIVTQQILDKIHCYYSHSFDIGHRLLERDISHIRQIFDEKTMEYDVNQDIFDSVAFQIYEHIVPIKKSCANIEGLNRLREDTNKFAQTLNVDTTDVYSFGYRYFYWDF
eukprot:308771_1